MTADANRTGTPPGHQSSVPETSATAHLVCGVTIGASAYTLMRGQLAWFASSGWRVTLATTPDDLAREAAAREGVDLEGIPMTRAISPLADLAALWSWIRVLRRTRPAVVNAGTPKAGLLGHLAAWLTRVPRRIYVVRGLRVEGASGTTAKVLWLMERLTIILATDVVFVSDSLAKEAQRRKLIAPGRAWLIGSGSSNGVDADAIRRRVELVDPTELRSELGLDQDAFVIGFIGRVARDKGVDTLIRAVSDPAMDPRAHLLIVGGVEDEELAPLIEQLERVHVIPWTDDVWGLLPALDVLCLPTRREGFPNVVLEAAAAAVPAVVTNATGSIDSVVDGETGLMIDVDDHHALVDRLNRVAADPELTTSLGRAAQERVRREFMPERIWRGLDAIFRGVGAGPDVRRV